MNVLGAALWNLLLNAAVSLAFALLGAALAARLARVRHPRLAIVLLVTPFVKAAYEIARGIPSTSFFWAKLAGATQEVGSFRVGLGIVAPVIPNFQLVLGALSDHHDYNQSIADVAATVLTRYVATWLPATLGCGLAALVSLRVIAWTVRRVRARRAHDAAVRSARLLELRRLQMRTVRVAIVDVPGLVPFAFGVLKPWVCIPRLTFDALSCREREAVIAHELAHLRFLDGPLLAFVDVMATAFWFVPGVPAASRAIRAHVELGADAEAARTTPAAMLASALVRVAELARGLPTAHAPGFLGDGHLLPKRVTALLEMRPASGVLRRCVHLTVTLVVASAILRATTFGNP